MTRSQQSSIFIFLKNSCPKALTLLKKIVVTLTSGTWSLDPGPSPFTNFQQFLVTNLLQIRKKRKLCHPQFSKVKLNVLCNVHCTLGTLHVELYTWLLIHLEPGLAKESTH
jgi:hypothetical protein